MIEDSVIREAVNNKLGIFGTRAMQSNLDSESLLKIRELSLSGKKLNGEKREISLRELPLLENLEILYLQYMELDTESVNILGMFKHLKTLTLDSCRFDAKNILSIDSLKKLSLRRCDIPSSTRIEAVEKMAFIDSEDVNFKSIVNPDKVKEIEIRKCGIKKLRELRQFGNLNVVSLKGSEIKDRRSIQELSREGINVYEEDIGYPMR